MADDQTASGECGICLETLTSAVTLPCSHRFCASCLDGWKSKFSSLYSVKEEKSKLCPLCREKIPPSKDMLIQLEYHRRQKRYLEARGDTTSESYLDELNQIKELEEEIGDYEGEGLDYDGCIELPKYIYDAVIKSNMKRVMKWLGSPIDTERLNARDPGHLNSTLAHLAVYSKNSDLLSILLQCGLEVDAWDARGSSPLILTIKDGLEQAKILLEWGAEISLPPNVSNVREESNKEVLIGIMKKQGNTKLANLVSSEFGGRRCEVINLPNHPQLNGKACVVEKYITKKEKYKIVFEGSGNAALVGQNNLKRRDRTPLDCGYYISFKNGRISRREFATKEECQAYVSSLGGGDVKESTEEELASLKL